ncbi:RecQ family zinc-binding domain-containing protein [Bacteroidetes bacterium endosymbiont of Geopemphigus sp.]
MSLLSFFGEKSAAKCGNCDICQQQKKTSIQNKLSEYY